MYLPRSPTHQISRTTLPAPKAHINVGDNYQDLGATITGPQQDLDTIDYVATNQSGLTATSTRTVIIESPTETASSSPAQ